MTTSAKPETSFEQIVRVTTYEAFQAREGIPVITGFAVDETGSLYVASYLLLFLLTQVTG